MSVVTTKPGMRKRSSTVKTLSWMVGPVVRTSFQEMFAESSKPGQLKNTMVKKEVGRLFDSGEINFFPVPQSNEFVH